MFDAVLNRSNVPKSRFGAGTVVSFGVHAAVVGLVVYLSTRPQPIQEDFSEVRFFQVAPPPPPPPPPPPKRSRSTQAEVKPPEQVIQPKEIPKEKPREVEAKQDTGDDSAGDEGVEGGVEGGVVGGVVGGVIGGVVGGVVGGTGLSEVIPFGEGMTRPVLSPGVLSDIQRAVYTREARAAQVAGLVIVKCNVLIGGEIRNCRIVKSVPFLAEALVRHLQTLTIKPATFQGKAVAIDYVFNFKFQLNDR